MARLPIPGSDDGTWGNLLNDFLAQAHNSDGTLRDGAVNAAAIVDATITEAKLDSAAQAKLNAAAGVTSVNSQVGAVVLDADDIGSGSTANKFVTAAEKAKLANLSGINTGDQTTITGNAGTATKLLIPRNINGVAFDGTTDIVVADSTKVPTTRMVNGHDLSADVTVTKSDVGLGNVDNTSDASKPVSTAVQAALNGKVATTTTVNGHVLSADVTVTKSDVGLGNVDNTSDASKPVSTATNAALSTKLENITGLVTQGTNVAISGSGTSASPYVISASGSGGGTAAWGSITGTLSDQADLQAAIDGGVRLDQDFYVTGDGTANITHPNPGVGIGVEVGTNNNAHIEVNSPTGGVAYLDFTTVNVDYAARLGWYDTPGLFKITSPGGDLITLNSSGDASVTGDLTAANLSGTNTGDQTLGDLGISATATELNYTSGVTGAIQAQLDSKQAGDSDLTAIAGLSPANDDIIQRKSGSWTNRTVSQLKTDLALTKSDIGLSNVDNTSDAAKNSASATLTNKTISGASNTLTNIAQSSVTNLTTSLSNKLDIKNGNPQLTDSTNDKFARIDITNDGSASSGWPDRFAFYYAGTRTGYHNEYGELRARPAKSNTVAFRAMGFGSGTANILEVAPSSTGLEMFAVSASQISASVPLNSTANITTTGTVSASNIGAKVTASSTAPSSPAVGDVWIDLSA